MAKQAAGLEERGSPSQLPRGFRSRPGSELSVGLELSEEGRALLSATFAAAAAARPRRG